LVQKNIQIIKGYDPESVFLVFCVEGINNFL